MALSHGDHANRTLPVERPPASRETEIYDYLRLIRRRWWIILLVPLFAGGIVVWAHSDDPIKYSATATVAARSLIGHVNSPYVGTHSTEAFAADFQATATQKPILQVVSEATQVSSDSIRDGLNVSPVSTTSGMSALINVEYVTTERDRAGPVAKQVALATVRALFQPAFRQAAAEAAAEAATEAATEGATGGAPVGEGTTGSLEQLLQQPQTLTLYPTTVESTTQSVIREVQIAVGAGLFLAIFIVIIADVWGPRSRETEQSWVAYDDEAPSHETTRTAPQAPASRAR